MVARCYSEKSDGYRAYGSRGITVYDEWLRNPETFEAWALDNGWQRGLTIDRIDNDRGYSPDNCRFVSFEENAKWQRKTHPITINGVTDSASGWEARAGLQRGQLNYRITKLGMDKAIEWLISVLEPVDKTA